MQDKIEIATLGTQEVEILETYQDEQGTFCLIRFEDGREDEVPLRALNF